MIKLNYIIFLLCVSFITLVDGVIYEVEDLRKFEEIVQKMDKEDLVLLDIDNTVLTPKDFSRKPCAREIRHRLYHVLDEDIKIHLKSILLLQGEEELMDPLFPSLISEIEQNGITIMGLTALETGELGLISHVEDWRISQLNKFSIHFSSTFEPFAPIFFTEFSSTYRSNPLFKEGIIFTDGVPKGEILISFFKKVDWAPSKILFVDDTLEQIQSVESAANKLGIEFIGLHYVAAEKNCQGYDPVVAELQYMFLIEYETWLTEEQAKALIEQ